MIALIDWLILSFYLPAEHDQNSWQRWLRPGPVDDDWAVRHRPPKSPLPRGRWTCRRIRDCWSAEPFLRLPQSICIIRDHPRKTSTSDIRSPDPSPPPYLSATGPNWSRTLEFEPRPPILGRQPFPTPSSLPLVDVIFGWPLVGKVGGFLSSRGKTTIKSQ